MAKWKPLDNLKTNFQKFGSMIPIVGSQIEADRLQKEADKINPERPTYTRPEEFDQNVRLASQLSKTNRLAGQSYMEEAIKNTFAGAFQNSLNNLSSNADLLASLNTFNTGMNKSMTDLNLAGTQQRFDSYGRLMNARKDLAVEKKLEFDYNLNEPYLMEEKRKRELGQAATQQRNASRQELMDVAGLVAGGMTGSFGGGKTGSNYGNFDSTLERRSMTSGIGISR